MRKMVTSMLRLSLGAVAALGVSAQFAVAQVWLSPRPMSPEQMQQNQMPRPQTQQQQRPAQKPAPAPSGQAAQQGAVKPELAQVIGDWRIQCVSKPARSCQISQRQVNPNTKQLAFMIEFTRVASPKPSNTLSIMLPLGVRLGPPLLLSADQRSVATVPLLTCFSGGCVHITPIQEDVLNALRKVKGLGTEMMAINGRSVPITISMRGFNDAMGRANDFIRRS